MLLFVCGHQPDVVSVVFSDVDHQYWLCGLVVEIWGLLTRCYYVSMQFISDFHQPSIPTLRDISFARRWSLKLNEVLYAVHRLETCHLCCFFFSICLTLEGKWQCWNCQEKMKIWFKSHKRPRGFFTHFPSALFIYVHVCIFEMISGSRLCSYTCNPAVDA